MLASNYQMPANGWNGLIELSLGGVRKVRGNTKVLGAVGLNPDENHSKPVLTSVLRFLQGMVGCAQSSVAWGTKIPATGSSQRPLWCPPDSWSSANS